MGGYLMYKFFKFIGFFYCMMLLNLPVVAMQSSIQKKESSDMNAFDLALGTGIGAGLATDLNRYAAWLQSEGIEQTLKAFKKKPKFLFTHLALFTSCAAGLYELVSKDSHKFKEKNDSYQKLKKESAQFIGAEIRNSLEDRSNAASIYFSIKDGKKSLKSWWQSIQEYIPFMSTEKNKQACLQIEERDSHIVVHDRLASFTTGFGVGAMMAALSYKNKNMQTFAKNIHYMIGAHSALASKCYSAMMWSYLFDAALTDVCDRVHANQAVKDMTQYFVRLGVDTGCDVSREKSPVANMLISEKKIVPQHSQTLIKPASWQDFAIGVGLGVILTNAWFKYQKKAVFASQKHESFVIGFILNSAIALTLYEVFADDVISNTAQKIQKNHGMQLFVKKTSQIAAKEYMQIMKENMHGGDYIINDKQNSTTQSQIAPIQCEWQGNTSDIASGLICGIGIAATMLQQYSLKKLAHSNKLVSCITRSAKNWSFVLWTGLTLGAFGADAFLTAFANVLNTNPEVEHYIQNFSRVFAHEFIDECKREDWWASLVFKTKSLHAPKQSEEKKE
jgi:hypothetical protein